MSNSFDDTLLHVAERTLEQFTFMFAIPDDDAEEFVPAAAASVKFEGPFSGRLVLQISAEMLSALALNLLGLGESEVPTEVEQRDSLQELANVICGNLLPAFAGTRAVFDVHSPQVMEDCNAISDSGSPAAEALLALDEGQIRMLFFVSDKAALMSYAEDAASV